MGWSCLLGRSGRRAGVHSSSQSISLNAARSVSALEMPCFPPFPGLSVPCFLKQQVPSRAPQAGATPRVRRGGWDGRLGRDGPSPGSRPSRCPWSASHTDCSLWPLLSRDPVSEAVGPRGLPRALRGARADHAQPACPARCCRCAVRLLGPASGRGQLLVVSAGCSPPSLAPWAIEEGRRGRSLFSNPRRTGTALSLSSPQRYVKAP